VKPVGLMTLTANPSNFFAETEQVAFHPGNLVPGVDVTNDPLLQGRLFSYLDTQISRLGGPNFPQLPINRTHAPVNDMLRDGMHQTAVHQGIAPYRPNSLDGGCPFVPGAERAAGSGAYIEFPEPLPAAPKVRDAAASFKDHFSQPRLFWLSMSPAEREHIIAAYTFELSKCEQTAIRERVLTTLANIDGDLCEKVAAGLGLPAPRAAEPLAEPQPSPALSQIGRRWPVDGRTIGIITAGGQGLSGVRLIRQTIQDAGMVPLVISATAGTLDDTAGEPLEVQRTFANARSIEFDAILVADAPAPGADAYGARDAKADHGAQADVDPRVVLLLTEAYRHGKAVGAWSGGVSALDAAGIAPDAPGVVTGDEAGPVLDGVKELLAEHRVWDRFPPAP
jgi:catalase